MVDIVLVGAPVDCGKRRQGCRMGADALRVAGIAEALAGLGHSVRDRGDVSNGLPHPAQDPAPGPFALAENMAWTRALHAAGREAATQGVPIFLGGDHALSAGTVTAMAAASEAPLFVLWLDAHTDFHTPHSTSSGHLHGTPLAYATGQPGFEDWPTPPAIVPADQVCLMGLRSVDPEERAALARTGATAHDMRAIDEQGLKPLLAAFLDRVAAAGGRLHVSFDVDFLDPDIAPAVGTTVPGGATLREGHLAMELLCDSGLVTSLDLVELNPSLDERGRTAQLLVDLTASLFGRRIFDRPTRSY